MQKHHAASTLNVRSGKGGIIQPEQCLMYNLIKCRCNDAQLPEG